MWVTAKVRAHARVAECVRSGDVRRRQYRAGCAPEEYLGLDRSILQVTRAPRSPTMERGRASRVQSTRRPPTWRSQDQSAPFSRSGMRQGRRRAAPTYATPEVGVNAPGLTLPDRGERGVVAARAGNRRMATEDGTGEHYLSPRSRGTQNTRTQLADILINRMAGTSRVTQLLAP